MDEDPKPSPWGAFWLGMFCMWMLCWAWDVGQAHKHGRPYTVEDGYADYR